MRRRKEATERVRSSSPEVALATVRRPRLRCSPPRAGRGVGTTSFCGRQGQGRAPGKSLDLVFLASCLGRSCRNGREDAGWSLAWNGRRRRGLAPGETPAGFVFGLALEIRFLRAAKLFLALARFGGLALDPITRLALPARLGLGFLPAAVFLLTRAGVEKRTIARLALLGGQRRQHDAGLG